MRKLTSLLFLTLIIFISCSEGEDLEEKKVNITFKFTHNWDGIPITSADFNVFKFTTANGDSISIEKLRYLASSFVFNQTSTTQVTSNTYVLINLGEEKTSYVLSQIPLSKLKSLSFIFGFRNEDNLDGIYQDLNSASFNVPGMLGGGYHFMQFDGKFKDLNNINANFNYHAIRAVDRTDPNNLVFEDTSFAVDLGNISINGNATIEIKVNIAEWFKNPNTWDLNQLNTILMPNFNAQKMISANGKSVFSLGEITQ